MKSHCLLLSLAAIAASPAAEEMKFPPMPPVGGNIFQRSAEWVATGEVTLPVPPNFPSAEQVSVIPEKPTP